MIPPKFGLVKSWKEFYFIQIILNKDSNNELFYLTIGGFGLTGIITEATIKIYPAVSNQVNVLRQNFLSIKDAYELFLENKGKYDFYHALFNLNYITKKRQPGYLEMAKIIEAPPSKESISCDGINSLHWPVRLNIFGSVSYESNRHLAAGHVIPADTSLYSKSMPALIQTSLCIRFAT